MSTSIVPIPKIDVSVREATPADVPFIDGLQRENSKQLGFLAASCIESKIKAGQVLIAEEGTKARRHEGTEVEEDAVSASLRASVPSCLRASPLGYVISQDKYLHREELGLIVQLCVVKGAQRNLIGATLLKAAFERAAYGCRLFCLWCAQDIAANRFWEAMGFVPLAYRAGSEKKRRVHIFWQKRIRQDDDATPWWFPSKTGNGAMREDRIVLPIPFDKHWSDELPVLQIAEPTERQLTDKRAGKKTVAGKDCPKHRPRQFDGPSSDPAPAGVVAEKPKREKKPKVKANPKLIAAARELRDRWMDHVNAGEMLLEGAGKYDVSRALPEAPIKSMPLLPAA